GFLYSDYTAAAHNVRAEATALSQLVRDTSFLSSEEGKAANTLALEYAREVETREWHLLRNGHASPQAWKIVDSMYSALARYKPETKANEAFYGQALGELQELVATRRARIDDANVSIPGAFEVMLLAGVILTLLTTFDFKPLDDWLQLVMIAAASTLVGLAL